jgi:hypothetical protein
MFVIRKDQQRVLAETVTKKFVMRVERHLNKIWPQKCNEMGAEAVQQSIWRAIDEAKYFGVSTERNVVRYLDLIYSYDWGAYAKNSPSWVTDILHDSDLTGDEKIDQIYQRIRGLSEKEIWGEEEDEDPGEENEEEDWLGKEDTTTEEDINGMVDEDEDGWNLEFQDRDSDFIER